MAIVVGLDGGLGALIPQLEQDHIAKAPAVERVKVYPEYPTGGTKHPLLHLADLLSRDGTEQPGTRIGYDNNGYLDINGYDGPLLAEIVAAGVETVPCARHRRPAARGEERSGTGIHQGELRLGQSGAPADAGEDRSLAATRWTSAWRRRPRRAR